MNNKLKYIGKALMLSLPLIAVNILITYAAYIFARPDDVYFTAGSGGTVHLIFAAAMFMLSYFSFAKLITIYNKDAREEFVNAKNKPSFSATVLAKPYFWCDILLFLLIFALFDLTLIFPFAKDIAAIYLIYGWEAKLYSLCFMLPAVVLINLFARRSAYKVWMRTRRRIINGKTIDNNTKDEKTSTKGIGRSSKMIVAPPVLATMRVVAVLHSKNNPAVQNAELPEPDYSVHGTIVAVFYKLLMYVLLVIFGLLISAFAIAFIGPVVAIFAASLPRLFGKIFVAVIIIIPLAKIYNRFNQRRKFVKKLKKLCKENKFKLSRMKSPYKFMSEDTFIVTANGKTFECKTIGTNKSKLPLVLDPDGSGIIIHAFVFAGIRWWHYTEEFNFAFESKYKKILIINPSAKFVYKNRDGEYGEIDNGDTVADYTIHTGGSFLNGLNRDCLDRKVKEN